jgi:PAS domain S-box-containing protein
VGRVQSIQCAYPRLNHQVHVPGPDTSVLMQLRGDAQMAINEDLLELVPDPVIGLDTDHRIVYWSTGAETTYGFSRWQVIGRRAASVLQTRFPMPLREIQECVADTGHWEGNLVQRAEDGRELTVQSRWAARHDAAGTLLGVLEIDRGVIAVDRWPIDESADLAREREDERDSSDDRSEDLESLGVRAGLIGHDFNNLLAVIINYAAFISTGLDAELHSSGDERWASMGEDLAQIQAAAERATALTSQLLTFTR